MGVFEQMPYTNYHGVNLDWILRLIRDHETRITALETWKVVTDGRLDSLEGRMTSAEADIDELQTWRVLTDGRIASLEDRTTTAEGDIDALEERMDTAEEDIDALEGRADAAESAIDALESALPAPTGGQRGFFLTATGTGTAEWKQHLRFYTIEEGDPALEDPTPYYTAFMNGVDIYICVVDDTNGLFEYRTPVILADHDETAGSYAIYFYDIEGKISDLFGISNIDQRGELVISKTGSAAPVIRKAF